MISPVPLLVVALPFLGAACAIVPPEAFCRAGEVDVDQIARSCAVLAQPEAPAPGSLEFRILPSGVRVRSGGVPRDPQSRFLASGLSVRAGGTATLTVEIRNVSPLPLVTSLAYTPGSRPVAYVDEADACSMEAEVNGELALTAAPRVLAITLAPGGVIRQKVEVWATTPGCQLSEEKKIPPHALAPGSHAFRILLPILDSGTAETGVRWQEFHVRVDVTS